MSLAHRTKARLLAWRPVNIVHRQALHLKGRPISRCDERTALLQMKRASEQLLGNEESRLRLSVFRLLRRALGLATRW